MPRAQLNGLEMFWKLRRLATMCDLAVVLNIHEIGAGLRLILRLALRSGTFLGCSANLTNPSRRSANKGTTKGQRLNSGPLRSSSLE